MTRMTRKVVFWRGRMVAVEHGILTITDLYNRLKPLGLSITKSQLERICKGQPKRLTLQVLEVFCEAFKVDPGELLVLETRPPKKPKTPKEPSGGATPPQGSDKASLLGPPTPTVPKSKWHD